jgi:hypothetical protein
MVYDRDKKIEMVRCDKYGIRPGQEDRNKVLPRRNVFTNELM